MERHSKGGRKAGTGGLTMLSDSPCDECEKQDSCRKEGVCCKDYVHYMKKGKVINSDRNPFMPITLV